MPGTPRFLQLTDVAEVLNISAAQAYALVRSGELPAIKIGGRGQWRVQSAALGEYSERMHSATKEFIDAHPYGKGDDYCASRRRHRHRTTRRPPDALRSAASARRRTTGALRTATRPGGIAGNASSTRTAKRTGG